jgi:UDP-N-acetylmuramoyl-L-alanyl-D-glutamate--2,6-diaminopimelate ligase
MLKKLAPVKKVSGISTDSRTVKKGDIFVAVKGLISDGHDFIPEIIKKGVKIIVGERSVKVPRGVIYLKVRDSKEVLGELASKFYGFPSRKLVTIGVTGTKGKTTTCHIIHHLLTKLGKKAGLISSITSPGYHTTTPDAITLNRMLRKMVDEGCQYAVIEVSSHGIDQKRIAGV